MIRIWFGSTPGPSRADVIEQEIEDVIKVALDENSNYAYPEDSNWNSHQELMQHVLALLSEWETGPEFWEQTFNEIRYIFSKVVEEESYV